VAAGREPAVAAGRERARTVRGVVRQGAEEWQQSAQLNHRPVLSRRRDPSMRMPAPSRPTSRTPTAPPRTPVGPRRSVVAPSRPRWGCRRWSPASTWSCGNAIPPPCGSGSSTPGPRSCWATRPSSGWPTTGWSSGSFIRTRSWRPEPPRTPTAPTSPAPTSGSPQPV